MAGGWSLARRTFWKRLPPTSLALFLSAVFFTFASMGFLDDIRTGARAPSAALVWSTLLAGTIAAGYAYSGVFTAVLGAARAHGRQHDDQTVLLIRYQSTGVASRPS
jgi:hypothetical protein